MCSTAIIYTVANTLNILTISNSFFLSVFSVFKFNFVDDVFGITAGCFEASLNSTAVDLVSEDVPSVFCFRFAKKLPEVIVSASSSLRTNAPNFVSVF